jgi:uncharacterized protein DUF2799
MKFAFFVLCGLALAGCAGMDAGECRAANWYELGFRDAIFGLQPQDNSYGDQCSKHGVGLDSAAYIRGWREGVWEADQRRGMSID